MSNPYPYPDPCMDEIPPTTCYDKVTGITLVEFSAHQVYSAKPTAYDVLIGLIFIVIITIIIHKLGRA